MDLAIFALIGWGGVLAIGVSLLAEHIPPKRPRTCKQSDLPRMGNVITSQVSYVALEPHGDVAAGSVIARSCRIHLN